MSDAGLDYERVVLTLRMAPEALTSSQIRDRSGLSAPAGYNATAATNRYLRRAELAGIAVRVGRSGRSFLWRARG